MHTAVKWDSKQRLVCESEGESVEHGGKGLGTCGSRMDAHVARTTGTNKAHSPSPSTLVFCSPPTQFSLLITYLDLLSLQYCLLLLLELMSIWDERLAGQHDQEMYKSLLECSSQAHPPCPAVPAPLSMNASTKLLGCAMPSPWHSDSGKQPTGLALSNVGGR